MTTNATAATAATNVMRLRRNGSSSGSVAATVAESSSRRVNAAGVAVLGAAGSVEKAPPAFDRPATRHTAPNDWQDGVVPMPFAPMLASTRPTRPLRGDWVIEPKFDGWRVIVAVDDAVRVWTGNGHDLTDRLPELAPLVDY